MSLTCINDGQERSQSAQLRITKIISGARGEPSIVDKAIVPIPGLSASVHHSEDEYRFRFDAVDYTVREHVSQASTHVPIKRLPCQWGFQNPSNRVLDRFDESMSNRRVSASVIASGGLIFFEGFRMEVQTHQSRIDRTF